MAHAYTPGLQIKASTRFRIERRLPISGEVVVTKGQQVDADDIVAKTEQPGNIYPINLSNQLSVAPADVPGAMLKQVGDPVEEGELIARSSSMFGLFHQECHSSNSGVIESISNVTGQVIVRGAPIPVQVDAFISGVVGEVFPNEGVAVEAEAAFLQGIFGIGGEGRGNIRVVCDSPDQDLTPDRLGPKMSGRVVVGGRRIHGETVALAREMGVTALIAGGIDDQDLKEILGYDLGVAITGTEDIGLTIIVTEGFGEVPMADRTFELFQSLEGQRASVNGATQIRAGVLRPEIVIPLSEAAKDEQATARVGGGVLEVGSSVRLIRDPYFGNLGTVVELPTEPQLLESGSRARVLNVKCQTGETVTVPRANVEIVGN